MFGGVLTIIFISMCSYYLGYLIVGMYNFDLDVNQSQNMINDMSSDRNNYNMMGRFLPTFEIRSLQSSPTALENFKRENPQIDILDTGDSKDEDTFPINLDKLSKYMEF